jgi:hypothetical protein
MLSSVRVGVLLGCSAAMAWSQGPTPETGNTIFPGGAMLSYGVESIFRTAPEGTRGTTPSGIRPTFELRQPFRLSLGVRRDFELTAMGVVATNHLDGSGGTGFGDTLVLLKYRFLRLDSPRGTTQASIAAGAKFATGRTDLRDAAGSLLPASLQPGSGSTDPFVSFNGTYTGLFNIKKLVADAAVEYLHRTEGTQSTKLGDDAHTRLYFPYRPYQSHSVGREWWIGPHVVWSHRGYDRARMARQWDTYADTGGEIVSLGAATYFSPRAGLELWFGIDFPVIQRNNGVQDTMERHISFGIGKQFQFRH